MTAVMIVCCAVPVSAETSGSYDYAAVHCSHDTVEDFGETALNKFVRDIVEIYQPQAVKLALDTFPVFADAAANGRFSDEVGLYVHTYSYENDDIPFHGECERRDIAAAWCREKDGGSGNALSVNAYFFLTKDGEEYRLSDKDKEKLVHCLSHETVHLCMDEYNPLGMLAITDPSQYKYLEFADVTYDYVTGIMFPSWFTEGIASTCDNIYSFRINIYNQLRTDTEKEAGIYTEENVLNCTAELKAGYNSTVLDYGIGGLGALYLGELAYRRSTGGTSEDTVNGQTVFSSAKIAEGLNTILKRMHEGESLSAVIADISDFSDSDDFERGFITGSDNTGHPDSLGFVTKLLNYFDDITAGGTLNSNTSLLGDYGIPFSSLFTDAETDSLCYMIAPTSDLVPCSAVIPTPYTDGAKGDTRPSSEKYQQIIDEFDWLQDDPTTVVGILTWSYNLDVLTYVLEKVQDHPAFTSIVLASGFRNPQVREIAHEMGLYGDYTVRFVNERGDAPEDQTVRARSHITEPQVPSSEGYRFIGWFDTKTGKLWNFGTDTVRGDVTLSAKWAVNQYTVTFVSEGTVIASITADYGTPITAPSLPEKKDYIFDGWDKPVPAAIPAEDMVITAQWRSKRPSYIPIDATSGTAAITTAETTANTTPDITRYTVTGRQNELNAIALKWDSIPNVSAYALYVKVDGKYVFVQDLGKATNADVVLSTSGKYYVSTGEDYTIYKYDSKTGKFTKTGTLKADKIENIKKANNVTEDFMVKHTVNGKESAENNSYKVSVKIYYKPAVKITANNGSIMLRWSKVPGAEKYRVYKYVNGKLRFVTETEKRAVRITGTKAGKEYSYAVKALVDGKWTKVYTSDIATVTAK